MDVCYNRWMAKQSKSRITPINLIVVACIIFAGAGLYAWWQYSYTNPTKVFNRMLANNLATPSVTKTSSQAAQGQSLEQTSILVTTPKQYVASQSTITQGEGSNATKIVTETLAFPTEEYTRYLTINTAQKSSSGKPFNFDKVLNIWGKTTQADAASGNEPQTFSQVILGVVPVGHLNPKQRQQLVSYIQKNNVFGIDANKVTKSWQNNRLIYTYQGSVKPVPYVTMLKLFARSMGLVQLDSVNPEQYKDSAPIAFSVTVDVISGQMTSVQYTEAERQDVFSAYGYRPVVNVPKNTVPISELQDRLRQVN